MILKRERIVVVKDGKILETTNFIRKREFIVAFGHAYPLSNVKILDDFRGGKTYLIIEDSIPKEELEKLQRLVVKEELYNITKALLWYTSQPTRTIIAILIAGIFAGTYLKYLSDTFFQWLATLPADTVAEIFKTLNIVFTIAMIAVPVLFLLLRKNKNI